MAKELSRRFAPLSGGFAAVSAATRLRIAAFALCIVHFALCIAAMTAAALPVENNDFWNTTGYVAPATDSAVSQSDAICSFERDSQPSTALPAKFRSDVPKATVLYLR